MSTWTGKYKTGLKPVQAQPRLMLSRYYTSDLPTVESLKYPLGHADLVKPELYLNATLGDCAIAGSQEEVRYVNALRGVTVNFTDKTAAENYSAITGYEPGPEIEGFNEDGSAITNPDAPPNPTDQGTDVHELFEYRQSTGIIDADGNGHKVIAYAGLTPGDWDEMLIALSLFQIVGIGIQVPDYAEEQFEAGHAWHLVQGRHQIIGGHYIPPWGASSYNEAQLPTWGGEGAITAPFYQAMNTVAVVALTAEMFKDGPAGVDFEKLAHDLPELNTGPVMAKAPRGKPRAKVSVDGVDQGPGKAGTRPDDAHPGERIG